jgi:hypothetical protein
MGNPIHDSSPEGSVARRVGRKRQDGATQLGERLLRLLAPLRATSLSLHNADGELIWQSGAESNAGESHYVREAGDAFALEGSEQYLERTLDDGRRALFFCSRSILGERDGLACALADGDADIEPAETAAVRQRVITALRRFGMPESPASAGAVAAVSRSTPQSVPPPALAPEADTGVAVLEFDSPVPEFAAAPQNVAAAEIETSQSQSDAASESESAAQVYAATPAPEPPAPQVPLRSRPYSRLRSGGSTRRYEIASDGPTTLAQDLCLATRLIHLLKERGSHGAPAAASFTLPLGSASVLAWDFLTQLTPAIREAKLADGMLGFSIPAAAWERHHAATENFLEQCVALGCFAALEDFNLNGSGFALLRSSAVRCLKLDAALIESILSNKHSHATVVACVKAARVLGLYCVAKGVKSPSTARWLGSAGIDYAERLNRGPADVATTSDETARAAAN